MGMFGSTPSNLRLDEPGAPIDVSGVSTALPQATPAIPSQNGMPLWKAALGGLLDSIAQQTGGHATFIPALLQRQQQQAEQQSAMDRWKQQYDYQLANPKPVNNDTANDYAFWQQHLTPAQFEQWKQKNYDPVVSIPLGNGSIYTGPRSQMGAYMGGAASPSASPNLPTVSDQQSYDAVPAGGQYRDPSGHIRTKGGGAGNGAGGFHIPSGSPLSAR